MQKINMFTLITAAPLKISSTLHHNILPTYSPGVRVRTTTSEICLTTPVVFMAQRRCNILVAPCFRNSETMRGCQSPPPVINRFSKGDIVPRAILLVSINFGRHRVVRNIKVVSSLKSCHLQQRAARMRAPSMCPPEQALKKICKSQNIDVNLVPTPSIQ